MKVIIYRTTENYNVHIEGKRNRERRTRDKFLVFEQGEDTPTLAEFLHKEHAEAFVKAMGWDFEYND